MIGLRGAECIRLLPCGIIIKHNEKHGWIVSYFTIFTTVELSKCRPGFYHADMHPGNTKYRNGQFTWMDFDKACMSYNVMDIGWLLTTGWIHYQNQMQSVERSRRLFDEVYAGYSMEQSMSDDEIKAAIHSTAIIHFEGLGIEAVMHNKGYALWLIDREYEWLMRWRECCNKLGL